ncbi:MAG: hypothetical protein QOJ43_29 [Gaiellaceae bacterium]|nr:hypothetical protein [Gaiellaceae bacterium]
MKHRKSSVRNALAAAAIGAVAVLASGCGGSKQAASPTTPSAAAGSVLPVAKNPISNPSTAAGLTITKTLVENTVAPDTNAVVADHLEIALANTSAKPLDQIEIYYSIADRKKGVSEGYYTKLDGFTIAPGATRVVHFDPTGAKDHYPVNKYSLYYTDKNALVVDVMASAPGVQPATATVKKDAGGPEDPSS